ncbi:hypothetical protein FORC48_2086 [Bacillus cereus]|nr:hypothetical protein FORC48_2086 [Bacillus cereus]
MYKKMHRVIENKKGIPSESKESSFLLFLASELFKFLSI